MRKNAVESEGTIWTRKKRVGLTIGMSIATNVSAISMALAVVYQ